MNNRNSGRVERTFCINGVASESGGVKVSSITILMPIFGKHALAHGLEEADR